MTKSIMEILEETIRANQSDKFNIKSLLLGTNPMIALIREIRLLQTTNEEYDFKFMGIPIKLHNSDDAIMVSLELKKL